MANLKASGKFKDVDLVESRQDLTQVAADDHLRGERAGSRSEPWPSSTPSRTLRGPRRSRLASSALVIVAALGYFIAVAEERGAGRAPAAERRAAGRGDQGPRRGGQPPARSGHRPRRCASDSSRPRSDCRRSGRSRRCIARSRISPCSPDWPWRSSPPSRPRTGTSWPRSRSRVSAEGTLPSARDLLLPHRAHAPDRESRRLPPAGIDRPTGTMRADLTLATYLFRPEGSPPARANPGAAPRPRVRAPRPAAGLPEERDDPRAHRPIGASSARATAPDERARAPDGARRLRRRRTATPGPSAAAAVGTATAAPTPAAVKPGPVAMPKEPDPGPPLPPLTYDSKGRRDPFVAISLAKRQAGIVGRARSSSPE